MMNKLRALIFALFLLAPLAGHAQESLSLSVTPPVIQLGVKPGDYWASSLKVVNTNPSTLTIYPSVMNFSAEGEEGHGKFEPIREKDPTLLASWIEISRDAVEVPAGQSRDIPFALRVPSNAAPGGHYAAVLVGTKPLDGSASGPTVKVSSFVSTLFLVRVSGEVVERAGIREFSTDRRMYDSPDVNFSLRFENSGNVHVQPQGNVAIYNMWGKKRGEILVNHKTDLGQVLPQSVRKFEFQWNSEGSFFDIGQYSAIATLTYGREARQNVTRTITFWIIPWKETAGVIGSFAAIVLLVVWGIRRYVRKALEAEIGKDARGPARAEPSLKTLARPVVEGVVDLRRLNTAPVREEGRGRFLLRRYRTFLFVVLPFLLLVCLWLFGFFGSVLQGERAYEVETRDPQITSPGSP